MVNKKTIYQNAPSWLKRPLKDAFSRYIFFKYRGLFKETYEFLEKSQYWSAEKFAQYQMDEVSKLLSHSYCNSPYYRKLFNECGLKPRSFQTLEDLQKIPVLEKEDVRGNLEDMLPRNFDKNSLALSSTSGTSGKPLKFYCEYKTNVKEMAFIYHQWSRADFMPGDRRIELRGSDTKGGVIYDKSHNSLRFSPVIKDIEQIDYYLREMGRFNAQFLHGYPQATAHFALMLKKHKKKPPCNFKTVFLASEPAYEWQRNIIEEVFNCRTFSHYGMTEKVALASECEHSRKMHFLPQYGITEFDLKTKEIIATGFLNYATPFIRYRTGDIAHAPEFNTCDKCGRGYQPITEGVAGRMGDAVITPSGTVIPCLLFTFVFKKLKHFVQSKIIQKTPNSIVVYLVPNSESEISETREEAESVKKEMESILGENIQVTIKLTDSINAPSDGKFKWFTSVPYENLKTCGIYHE